MFNLFSSSDRVDISTEEFKQKLAQDPGVVLDVRTKDEYDAGHLKLSAAQHDWLNGEFQDAVDEMDKDKTYYLYCRSGNRSGQAAKMMRDRGFKHAYNVGGFEDLVEEGFEAVIPEADE